MIYLFNIVVFGQLKYDKGIAGQ